MSERQQDAEIPRMQCSNEKSCGLIDEDEIIDVSVFDFDDIDAWLFVPAQRSPESTIHDIYTWLRSEPEVVLSGNKKYIDTRTFTRPKKRSSRTSFESIFEAMTTPVSNIWKTQCSNFPNIEETISKSSGVALANQEETVPFMLKTAPTAAAHLLTDEIVSTSGHESMEVFLNMSHSKGIDSFINLTEPGFSDPLMNVSQPSIFYSSITSLAKDDSLHNEDYGAEEKSVNFSHILKQEELNSNNVNETFSRNHTFDTNRSYSVSPADRTFTNTPKTFDRMDLNETYNADTALGTLTLSSSDRDKSRASLSSTFVNTDDGPIKSIKSQSRDKNDFALDSTYLSHEMEKKSVALDATYLPLEPERKNKDVTLTIDVHKDNIHSRRSINNIPAHLIETATPITNSSFSSSLENLNSAYKFPTVPQSTPKTELNSTFKSITKNIDQRLYNAALCSNFKAPMSLRRELLTEIHRSEERKLDSTYNNIGEHLEKDRKNSIDGSDHNKGNIPVENRYNTYKKESPTDRLRHQKESNNTARSHDSQDRKYYTFTKKSIAHGKTDMENAESLENVNSTFVKPLPKLQKRTQQQHIPRMFSKLPQILQKSNPNLVSNSLKTVNIGGNTGYLKGSQPNIAEKGLTNKLYSLGKIKSGSEQRLVELNTNTSDFQLMGAGGSTESIESTQSAHSAPDLDDRLSTCSDCSHNSYSTQTMNIEQLHQIVRMQEESLKQDATPKLNRRVLENTWIEGKKETTSPILKNGIESYTIDASSPLSSELIGTSSPIISPIGSSQSINTDGHPMENILKHQNEMTMLKKVQVSNKPVAKMENRTRLRQPTNWSSASRPANVTSAIPRPASRIPAPRFAKPAAKTQADTKRGYM